MNVTATIFIIFCLAVWRISSLLANEDGPFYVFSKFRSFAKSKTETNKLLNSFHFSEGLECEWCNSIWVAFPAAFVLFDHNIFNSFFVPLAASTVTIFLKYILEAVQRSNKVMRVKRSQDEKITVNN